MKKFNNLIVLVLALVTLGACATSNSTNSSQSTSSSHISELKATVTIKESEDKVTKKEVNFTDSQTVMDMMKSEFKIEETNGLITSINGVSQDQSKNTYWMYTVNGKMAEKGASETTLKNGDKVEFYLQAF
ncbi:Additional lipoprotein component of putative cobalamin ECF transporter [Streptococcus sp. DD10]|uniref:DUF4430 domain-containing protein n=1 Tax=Streptococcus sp. DD10 TaxID=1777878 RepID=UPI000797749D|nr:DUF4430 domain-containing protein [Streptococcus sp. DD10]KXT77125.1 Additional lipoprotein component of putative cobalamin ECF transporter [Streptococcus sp. DD10]